MADKPSRDRITLELAPEDRTLIEEQRKALGLSSDMITDAKLVLGVYRRFAGQVARPTRR